MSIFFNFEVGPSERRFRRAVDDDQKDIEDLMTGESNKLFGDVDIGMLIELSTLSICMINEDNEILGFMSIWDSPNVPGVDPADWEVWIRNMFQRYYMARNTLFIHFMCCRESVSDLFLDEAIVTVFDHDVYLNQIVLIIPPGSCEDILRIPSTKKRNVFKFCARRLDDSENNHFLYTFVRHEFCPKLKMRRAVEEDNDDIVEILNKKCPRLIELYGNYYISEIIGRHKDSKRKIIVAEQQDHAVGVMCLNSEVNYESLETNYELHSFYGFKQATPLEKEEAKRNNVLLNEFGEPIMNGKWSPFQRMVKIERSYTEEVDKSKEIKYTAPRSKKMSKVNFRPKSSMRKSLESINYFRHDQSDDFSDKVFAESPFRSRDASYSYIDFIEEDEPFDYEIVNIDRELLAIPEALSFECLSEASDMWRKRRISNAQNRRISRTSLQIQRKPKKENFIYHGEPNAFIIELVGFRDDIHDRHAFDLLEAAFEKMKKFDYCLISVPTKDKVFPLLEHFCFIPAKPDVCTEYALYAAHRSSVLGRFRVRPAELADVPQIANLLQTVEGQDTVWTIENSVLHKDQYQAYVFLSGLSIIGVGIIEPPEQTDFIRSKYNVDVYHNHKYHSESRGVESGFSTIKVAIVYPAFEVHFRFFARELMRFSGSCALMWLTAYRNKLVAHKANSIASAMIPLIPKKSEIDCISVPEHKKIEVLAEKLTAFSCWFLGKKMTTMPKVDVNQRIVLVGASRTTMAFLDTLLFSDTSTYLNFTSVTLISPYGLPYTRQAKKAAETMFPQFRTSANKFLKSVPYTYYVNVIQGTMVDINKRDKYVTLANGSKYYYDLLFLLLGKQYQHPNYLQDLYEPKNDETVETPYVRLDVPRLFNNDDILETTSLPENVFVINTIAQANRAIKYVSNFVWDYDYNIIVYGSSIHAYCCIAALREAQVPAKNIIFVEPFPQEHKTRVPIFCNIYVDKTINEMLKRLNITVYRSYYFQSWTVDSYNTVTHVDILSYAQMITLECSAFFYYGKTGVSAQALNAIKKSGLVYDGGILIDHKFKTKDPYIYASGPATRFFRRYYADSYQLKYFDSYEVGEMLGTQIRNMLDPLFTPTSGQRRTSVKLSTDSERSEKSSYSFSQGTEPSKSSTSSYLSSESKESSQNGVGVDRLPVLKKPLVCHCYLPGGLQYLEVRPPGRRLPHYFVQTLEYNGTVMETFKSGYFKLHLDSDYIVNGVTCLSPGSESLENFRNLYGLSAVVLNNVHIRYAAKKIDNFYDFFRAKWALYLYHDRVSDLFAMVKELFPQGQRKGETLKETLLTLAEMLCQPTCKYETQMRMRSGLEKSLHVEAITQYVMHWVHDKDLPMYLRNETKAEMHRDLHAHAAFKKKKRSLVMFLKKLF